VAKLQEITDQTFEQEVQGSTPVLVDFWAEWCGPCRMIAPVLEQIAAEQASNLKIVKLNSDENPESVRRFRIMSIPTLILFKDGKPVEELKGFMPKPQLLNRLRPHLDGATNRA
jgi:thioredoxin